MLEYNRLYLSQREEEDGLRKTLREKLAALSETMKENEQGLVIGDGENIRRTLQQIQDPIGTHYICEIFMGDTAYQVYTFEKEMFQYVCGSMDKNGWNGYRVMASVILPLLHPAGLQAAFALRLPHLWAFFFIFVISQIPFSKISFYL